ncbi:PREDICTED: serine/threonine-protein kinase 19 isoform X2 [Myotis brandtii]|uniref:serine/threonine-protein kinase 19 isoform X2 n=1 Tax=Myotis brandtii TaxID=109478 RepID=UPI00070401FE|nr:PREDICTED: serine/threonine-protein kinase 19 isoform X2 [Myotis brandtii]
MGGWVTNWKILFGDSPDSPHSFSFTWRKAPQYGQRPPGMEEHLTLIAFFSPPSSWKQKELQEQGEIRVIQLGFDLDAHGIVLTEDYRTRVLKACDGRSYAGAVQKFLALVLPACGDLSFQQDQMTQTFGFRDTEITQLVNAGVLTVRDAGSWWLAVPGAGRFIKYFVKGRQAVLGMVRKAKYRELLLSELLARRAPASVRLGLAYHVHDLIGAQLVDW